MAILPIRINGREYHVACDDGQEEQLQILAQEVDERVGALLRGMNSNPGEIMTLLLTSLMMADELIENEKENEKVAAEVRRLATLVNDDGKYEQQDRMAEIEQAMAVTLEEIAIRIEKIADSIELE